MDFSSIKKKLFGGLDKKSVEATVDKLSAGYKQDVDRLSSQLELLRAENENLKERNATLNEESRFITHTAIYVENETQKLINKAREVYRHDLEDYTGKKAELQNDIHSLTTVLKRMYQEYMLIFSDMGRKLQNLNEFSPSQVEYVPETELPWRTLSSQTSAQLFSSLPGADEDEPLTPPALTELFAQKNVPAEVDDADQAEMEEALREAIAEIMMDSNDLFDEVDNAQLLHKTAAHTAADDSPAHAATDEAALPPDGLPVQQPATQGSVAQPADAAQPAPVAKDAQPVAPQPAQPAADKATPPTTTITPAEELLPPTGVIIRRDVVRLFDGAVDAPPQDAAQNPTLKELADVGNRYGIG